MNNSNKNSSDKLPEDSELRTFIKGSDRIRKLSSDLNISASSVVNLFVEIGCEAIERAMPLVKEHFEKKLKTKLKLINKKPE